MFFCLICEQVGCSTPPPPSCNENETRVKIMFIVRPPSHCAPQKYKIQIQCTMWQEEGHITTGSQPAVICFPLAWFCFFFRFFCLSGFWAQFCILGAFQLRAGSCLIVVIWLDIIFIVCQIIMMIIYETECLKRFPPAWEPNGQNNQPRRAFATQLWTSSHFYWLIFTSCGCFIVHLTTGCNF